MDITKIKSELQNFLTQAFKIQKIENSCDIFNLGIVHSLFFIQLLVFIEKKFKIELREGEFDITKLKNIDTIANLILLKIE